MYPSLNDPIYPAPPKPERPRELTGDPFAAVIGNATMLGIGYFLVRRYRMAAMSLAVTFWLVAFIAAAPETAFWRFVLAAWWIAIMLHTFWLVRPERRTQPEAPLVDLDRRERTWSSRVFAAAAVCLVAMAIVGIRFDTAQVMEAADAAHRDGDCEGATAATGNLDVTHRIADGRVAAASRENDEACELLQSAQSETDLFVSAVILRSYMDHPGALWEGAGPERAERLLRGALEPLTDMSHMTVESAFDHMMEVLDESPGQSEAIRGVVEGFLDDLAEHQAEGCDAKAVNDWLFAEELAQPELSEPVAAASGLIPVPILECARDQYATGELTGAQGLYGDFLAEFPDHELAATAAAELAEVELAIQREHVEGLLAGGDYCDSPAAYGGAEAYSGSGTNPMWVSGLTSSQYDVPSSWTTADVDETVLVVCVEGPERGSFLESCQYENADTGAYFGAISFYANKFTIEAYELRTGERVENYSVQIGSECPFYIPGAFGEPEREQTVSYGPDDLRELFERLQ